MYQQNGSEVSLDIDIIAHFNKSSNIVFITFPGLGGSANGYIGKYDKICDDIRKRYGVSTLQASYPAHSKNSNHGQNIDETLKWLYNQLQLQKMTGIQYYVLCNSASAHEVWSRLDMYSAITKVLAINPAVYSKSSIKEALKLGKNATILVGSKDLTASVILTKFRETNVKCVSVEGADHNFSGEHFPIFLEAPSKYLFGSK